VLVGALSSPSDDSVALRPFMPHTEIKSDPVRKVSVISIIDDDKSVRAATLRLVRSLGLPAFSFASADEFLQSPHVNDSSCVIADIRMPNMSGVELQSLLIAKGQPIPFIFITAFPEERIRTQALEAGAVCFLNKPFDGKTMVECLTVALKKHGELSIGDHEPKTSMKHVGAVMEQRRKSQRSRVLKSGKIILNNRLSIRDCTIRNLSKEGACLVGGHLFDLPVRFMLQCEPDKTEHACEVIWRHEDKIGVRFL
jgi:FixJ family two-component response regulator